MIRQLHELFETCTDMKSASLRELLRGPIIGLSQEGTHAQLDSICERLGLPPCPAGSKRERMTGSFNSAMEVDLPNVAENYLREFCRSPRERNAIQDKLWTGEDAAEIPLRYRHELSRRLGDAGDLYLRDDAFEALLQSLWIIEDDPLEFIFPNAARGLRSQIHQHVFRNPSDWSAEYLFEAVGAFETSDRRFALFLEGLASAAIRPDIDEQRRFVGIVNDVLRPVNVELREVEIQGGYPVFRIVWASKTVQGKPKNIIFASSSKPDLRFRDAVNNDIEIVSNPHSVLVYDRPVPMDGLRWRELQDWWEEKENVTGNVAKRTLYKRLLDSLPLNSPAQRTVFTGFAKYFGSAVPELPALLPEVWLHWDPKTVKERGPTALLRFRMDFLMLLPNSGRVVIEVDGKHHYADNDGRADVDRYAAMMSADRDLRLAGYEVYRFGASELSGNGADQKVAEFFDRLFRQYHVSVPALKSLGSARLGIRSSPT
jgi:very-short-patch-repair endonuclease